MLKSGEDRSTGLTVESNGDTIIQNQLRVMSDIILSGTHAVINDKASLGPYHLTFQEPVTGG